jgi:hypothetical protein
MMRRRNWLRPGGWVLRSAMIILALFGVAAAGNAYEIASHTIDGGGSSSASGGDYALAGTAGQPDAGRHGYSQSGSGDYEHDSGFWVPEPGASRPLWAL